MSNLWICFQGLGLVIGGVIIAFSANSAIAEITPDGTLPSNSQVTPPDKDKIINIDGGTKSGSNLFHSFDKFSIPAGFTANFQNVGNTENIFSRVTGKSFSDIQGTLKVDGAANLFLINPNGIVFGPNASLQLNGSFLATTASSVNFADGTKFSATNPQTIPLLKMSVPVGLQFGSTAAAIRNQSQAPSLDGKTTNTLGQPVGLQVQPSKTLALVGGDVILEGGNLTAVSGQIGLGSVARNSLVSLNPTNQGWILGYEGVQNFQNIQLIKRQDINGSEILSQVDASGDSGGNIQIQGRRVLLTDKSQILTYTFASQPGMNLTVNASDSVEIDSYTSLSTATFGNGKAGDITITTKKLTVLNGAQVSTNSIGSGSGGRLTVNALDSVELIDGSFSGDSDSFIPSVLLSATFGPGDAGNITINTGRLRLQGGARVLTSADGMVLRGKRFLPATGQGGDLTVNAADLVEITGTSNDGSVVSGLFTSTQGYGNAGKMTIDTKQLTVRDGAAITVSSQVPKGFIYQGDVSNLGQAGAVNISARSVLLDNNGQLTAEAQSGKGGNITLQVQNSLLLRRKSQISTSVSTVGDGGNITINARNGFIVAAPLENNDITANAFSDAGGNIIINAKGIFGLFPRTRADLERLLNTKDPAKLKPQDLKTSDITAFSQQNPSLNGTIQINTPDTDPKKGLEELSQNPIDATGKIVASCGGGGKLAGNSFTSTGRGGIASNPLEPLTGDAVVADWVSLEPTGENRAEDVNSRVAIQKLKDAQKYEPVNPPEQIVEAQGWVIDANGNVVLVVEAPTATPHTPALTQATCTVR
ncbi:filamentous hemagglutinin outer membrane protein [Cylindrospermum sp. NIES-4074]|nr:filamentous hemagglutinin outer membrane protein [Cylindrospermum sp. NIES-4074]